jgi:sec-independent protein translocase protein TatC
MQSISFHFLEIQLRLLYLLCAISITFFTAYLYRLELLYITSRPFILLDNQFSFIDLTEAFSTTLRICGIFTILLTCPLLVYHLWGFLIPSRYLFERKRFFFVLSLLIFCFCIEVDFLYFLIFPKLCEYLTSFGVNPGKIHNLVAFNVDFSPRMESYITLLLRVCIIFLFISQFPLICIVAYFKKWITCYDLCQIRKPLFFSSLLITAAISPPDIISQFIFLLLFFIVNEVLIIFGFIYDAKNYIIEEFT